MPEEIMLEMNFCRRCGSPLVHAEGHMYKCTEGHLIFANVSPAAAVALLDSEGNVLILERAIDPGKGKLSLPGGFCDGCETFEDAARRELQEETGLSPADYGDLEFVCSGLDPYEFKGETMPVVVVVFKAKLRPGVQPIAADDAASVEAMPLANLDLKKFQFPAIRKALSQLLAETQL